MNMCMSSIIPIHLKQRRTIFFQTHPPHSRLCPLMDYLKGHPADRTWLIRSFSHWVNWHELVMVMKNCVLTLKYNSRKKGNWWYFRIFFQTLVPPPPLFTKMNMTNWDMILQGSPSRTCVLPSGSTCSTKFTFSRALRRGCEEVG